MNVMVSVEDPRKSMRLMSIPISEDVVLMKMARLYQAQGRAAYRASRKWYDKAAGARHVSLHEVFMGHAKQRQRDSSRWYAAARACLEGLVS